MNDLNAWQLEDCRLMTNKMKSFDSSPPFRQSIAVYLKIYANILKMACLMRYVHMLYECGYVFLTISLIMKSRYELVEP